MDPTLHFKRLSTRRMIVIPLVLAAFFGSAVIAALALGAFPLARDFKGGTQVQVRGLENAPDIGGVEIAVENLLGADVDVIKVSGFDFDLETDRSLAENERAELENLVIGWLGVGEEKVHAYPMGSEITSIYKGQARNAVIGAVVAMAVIIFIVFRHRFAVGAILLSVGLDMVGVLGCMVLFGIELSLASVAGLLLLIGYAVDTNILLSTRVLKRVGGEAREHAASAMRTGLTMSGTTLLVLVALNLFTTAQALDQLSAVLICGVFVDIFNTWFLNAGLLLWYTQKMARREFYVSV